MTTTQHLRPGRRDFAQPDEFRAFHDGHAEILRIGGEEVGRLILEPGWRLSAQGRPMSGRGEPGAHRLQYHLSGTLRILMLDGTEFDATPGQLTSLSAVADAWVIGNDDVVLLDWCAAPGVAA